mmetsp:Transcript_66994/g.160524  ORF Transcript_66994/g.160524 Transcript_66994/m.160524 type:complete len:571 (+) Transcript_66994:70-1782(+)
MVERSSRLRPGVRRQLRKVCSFASASCILVATCHSALSFARPSLPSNGLAEAGVAELAGPRHLGLRNQRAPGVQMRQQVDTDQEATMITQPRVNAASKTAAIVGSGPAGTLTAIMLAQRGYQSIDIFDELAAPPPPADADSWRPGERSYQLGLNGRGQKALREFGCMERIRNYSSSVHGRLSLPKDGPPKENILKAPGTPGATKNYVSQVLLRDRLQACLLEEAQKYPQITVKHGVKCEGVDLSSEQPVLLLRDSTVAEEEGATRFGPVDLVVGADGVRSAVREALAADPKTSTKFVRFPDRNERQYKTLPLHPSRVPGTRHDLNWGAGNPGSGLGLDALPTKEGEMVGVLLFKPDTPIYDSISGLKSAADARKFFQENLPQVLPFVDDKDLQLFVDRPISRLPSFQMVNGDIHTSLARGAVVLLGDSIKTVKPYFGQGANSALEDVAVLRQSLDDAEDDVARAAKLFSKQRAEDARALVRISRSFDGPGKIGTARFVIPLLMDSLFNKAAPWVFSPPVLRALQDERNTFSGLERRKRWERFLQVMCIGTALGATVRFSIFLVRRVLALF